MGINICGSSVYEWIFPFCRDYVCFESLTWLSFKTNCFTSFKVWKSEAFILKISVSQCNPICNSGWVPAVALSPKWQWSAVSNMTAWFVQLTESSDVFVNPLRSCWKELISSCSTYPRGYLPVGEKLSSAVSWLQLPGCWRFSSLTDWCSVADGWRLPQSEQIIVFFSLTGQRDSLCGDVQEVWWECKEGEFIPLIFNFLHVTVMGEITVATSAQ